MRAVLFVFHYTSSEGGNIGNDNNKIFNSTAFGREDAAAPIQEGRASARRTILAITGASIAI